jgi:hypothetical protein
MGRWSEQALDAAASPPGNITSSVGCEARWWPEGNNRAFQGKSREVGERLSAGVRESRYNLATLISWRVGKPPIDVTPLASTRAQEVVEPAKNQKAEKSVHLLHFYCTDL